MSGEFAFLERLAARLPGPPAGEVWIGDDAAVLDGGRLLATDLLVDGVHVRTEWASPADIGWKALVVNLSDVAAMGGEPEAAVAAVALPPGGGAVGDGLVDGLAEAAETYGCPLVGGDLSTGPVLMLSVAVTGTTRPPAPVLRSGARPGDTVFVTGPLGAARAVLERLEAGDAVDPRPLHRPVPRLPEGRTAAEAGATAMLDLSDGLSVDLRRIGRASGVGFRIDAAAVPVGAGATLEQAVLGGDDYELCFTAPAPVDGAIPIGVATEALDVLLDDQPLPEGGWEHPL